MGLLDSIFGGGIGKLFKDVVGSFKLSPEAKLELDRELASHEFELAKLDREYETKLLDAQSREIEAASANIRAEAANGDHYTSRARPTFLYVCNVILAWNYIVSPLIGRPPLEFPEPLFWLFGSVMLGYIGGRSWEKVSGMRGGDHVA